MRTPERRHRLDWQQGTAIASLRDLCPSIHLNEQVHPPRGGTVMTTSTAVVMQELAVAAFKKVYDVGAVETALGELGDNANDALRATYEKMLRIGGLRFCVKP